MPSFVFDHIPCSLNNNIYDYKQNNDKLDKSGGTITGDLYVYEANKLTLADLQWVRVHGYTRLLAEDGANALYTYKLPPANGTLATKEWVNSKLKYKSILSAPATSTNTTYVNGTLSETCNNFDILLLLVRGSNGSQKTTVIIPSVYFNNTEIYWNLLQSSSVYVYGSARVLDTTIGVACLAKSGWQGATIDYVYGIKLNA